MATTAEKIDILEEKFPKSTQMERSRFLTAKKEDVDAASNMLDEYLKWREEHGLEGEEHKSTGNDAEDWDAASKAALTWSKENEKKEEGAEEQTSQDDDEATTLPQLVFLVKDPSTDEPAKANAGGTMLHAMPARMDLNIASYQTYVLALSLYLDRKFERDSDLMTTVCLDVRGGKGWSNPPALNIMPFIRAATTQLYNNYPQRLERCLLYPVPTFSLFIWEMAKPFLDRDLATSVTLLSGSDKSAAPPPIDGLSEYASKEIIEHMEVNRLSLFVESTE